MAVGNAGSHNKRLSSQGDVSNGSMGSHPKTVGEKAQKLGAQPFDMTESELIGHEEKPIWQARKEQLSRVMSHWSVNLLTLFMTLFALFGDDIRLAFFPKDVDFTFYNLTLICLIGFTIEITLNCLCQDNYFNSFYFYLDVISTISLIADIKYLMDLFTGEGQADDSGDNAEDASQLARAGRSARVGTRAGRMTRVIRLVRLIRIVRLYKQANERINRKAGDDEFARLAKLSRGQMLRKKKKELEDSKRALEREKAESSSIGGDKSALSDDDHSQNTEGDADKSESRISNVNAIDYESELKQLQALTRNEDKSESRVGRKLSESTQRAVIVLVLTMLLSTAFLQPSTYASEPEGYEFGLRLASKMRGNETAFGSVIDSYLSSYEDTRTPPLYINVPDVAG